MALVKDNMYEILHTEEWDLYNSYDWMSRPTSDLGFKLSAEEDTGLMKLNYSDHSLYADPSILRRPKQEVKKLIRYGLVHANWHPNHGLGYRPSEIDSAVMTQKEGLEGVRAFFEGEELEIEGDDTKVRSIYRDAVDDFQGIFGNFEQPSLIIDEPVLHPLDDSTDQSLANMQPVGYFIDSQNGNIVLNREMVDEVHLDLLNKDFQQMFKRYHDISLYNSLEDNVTPYVRSLTEENDLSVEQAYFADLEEGVADFNSGKKRLRVDLSRLKDFNPQTGVFESGHEGLPGGSIKLHEIVHDLDFSNNSDSRKYSTSIANIDINDPRNAVLEAPTTFEVYMAGWETRLTAIEAFESPAENMEFFQGYPVSNVEDGDKETIQDPYNMGLFTALSVHSVMMDQHGVEEGTEKTRQILFKNSWDLNQMEKVLEGAMEYRDVPNIPKYKRHSKDIIHSENKEKAADKEARQILRELEEVEGLADKKDLAIQGKELIKAYERSRGFSEPNVSIWTLDEALVNLRDELDFLN